MVLQYQINDKAQIIIYDISGRQLYQQVLDSANNKIRTAYHFIIGHFIFILLLPKTEIKNR